MKVWLFLACCWLVVGRIYTQSKDPPKLIATAPGANDETSDAQEDEPKRLVCYLNFETTGRGVEESGVIRVIQDKSGYDNNGELSEGGEILQQPEAAKDFTCNQYARLYGSEISFNGNLFQAKPRKAITIAAWIKLEDYKDPHSIFDTIGHSHSMGQYHFEVHNGVLRWFHRNECQQTVFETMAHEVPKAKWIHIAGTYNSKTSQAKAYIDGVLRNQSIGAGELSRDWDTKVRIGMAVNTCGPDPCKRPLKGSVDEFRIYNYALTPDEIHALVGACKNDEATTKPAAKSDVADAKKVEERRSLIQKERKERKKRSTKGAAPSTGSSKRSCSVTTKRSIYSSLKF
jgi:hypothetical protein